MLLHVGDMADKLGCSTKTVYRMVYQGRLPYRYLGRRLVFVRQEVDDFIAQLPGKTLDEMP